LTRYFGGEPVSTSPNNALAPALRGLAEHKLNIEASERFEKR